MYTGLQKIYCSIKNCSFDWIYVEGICYLECKM